VKLAGKCELKAWENYTYLPISTAIIQFIHENQKFLRAGIDTLLIGRRLQIN
jgi:hypothetical protein